MKIESIREGKANLNKIVGALPEEGSVVITKNGRPCAVLMPVTEDTDLEVVAATLQTRDRWAEMSVTGALCLEPPLSSPRAAVAALENGWADRYDLAGQRNAEVRHGTNRRRSWKSE
jgi:prevent-host-death family protein